MRLALLDLETTGASASRDEITECAFILVEDGVEEAWQSLFKVRGEIPTFVQRLTGICPSMLLDAPDFAALAPTLFERLDGAVLLAHNARFDLGFLKQAFRREGFDYRPKVLCSLKLARALYPHWPKHGLDALCEQIAYHREDRHRAMADVLAMKAFLEYAIAEHGEARVLAEAKAQWNIPSLPAHISSEALDAIPDSPGVYRFYGEDDALLYIGKSVSMRSRVLTHFSGAGQKALKIARQLRRIDYCETAGELGALLRESAEIKSRQPLFNRQLRRQRSLCAAELVADEQGYLRPHFRAGEAALSGAQVYLFKHRKQATTLLSELAKNSRLCPLRLGLERGGSCFAYQLGRCAGACCGQQSAADYNRDLLAGLAQRRVESWPFQGAVLIREPAGEGGRCDWHLIDRWRYFGSFSGRRPSRQRCAERLAQARDFDYDHYRILQGFREQLAWLELKP